MTVLELEVPRTGARSAEVRGLYVLARTARSRPTLQHRLDGFQASFTHCGLDLTGWSRSFTTTRIDVIMCRKCAGWQRSRTR
jgi:hypothetical protein